MKVFESLKTMHNLYEFKGSVQGFDDDTKYRYLHFRSLFIMEELHELLKAIESNEKEEIVDALIDISVVALGTLDLFQVDGNKAWEEVMKANMLKEKGINYKRKNKFDLPDLIKPTDWKAPCHKDNTGIL